MGSITTGIGLVSGINTAQLIDSLIALESRGKVNLQRRIATLQTQRTALLDINARLLNLKNSAKSLRLDKIFQSALATSGDDEVLTATAAANAQPGTFQFIVKQLVATSQKMTQGYADRTTTPVGLSSLSFEFGRGILAADRDLESLNAGAGVDRGRIIITDRSGAQATINLTDVTTLNEALERINNASGITVTASVDGDRLVITDGSGGAGTLTVANGEGDTTATDLGIAGSGVGNVLTGTVINTIGGNTALGALNDGNGVLTRNNVTDFTITARDGTTLSIDLGRINLPISNSTLLADLNNGTGVAINNHETDPDFKIVDRNGDTHEVKLDGVTTVGGLIQRITLETGGTVNLSVSADGKKFVVTDTTGGSGLLKVIGAGTNNEETANDLGILNTAGVSADSFEGSIIPNTITDPPAATINAVIDRINNNASNGGKIVASIAADGASLLITDTTGGADNLKILSTAANPYAAAALGIATDAAGVASSTIDGTRLVASLGSVLTKNINGGSGLGSATSITIKDRAGTQVTVNSLNTYDSLSEMVKAINDQASAAGVLVNVSLNNAGNGLQATDTSGGAENLVISGDGATALGIAADVAANSRRGGNLQHRYVSEAMQLKDLNYGRGIGLGKFRITDALGASSIVDIGSDSTNLQDIIEEINSRPIAVQARINDTGDGLIIESDLAVGQTAVTKIKVESVSGTTAKDLNILGTSSTIEDAQINGSYERTVTLAASDSLDKVMKKINDAGIPVNASVINSGSGATPFRLNFTSGISGRLGELSIDSGDVDLGLTVLTKGQDAKVFFGSDNPENGFLVTSSTNSITGTLDGVTVNLHSISDTPVSLTVTRDIAKISDAVKQMITNFNDAIGRINQYDFFDVETEQRGPLLGNSTTSQVRDALYRIANGRAQGVSTQYQYLRDVGIKVNSSGELVFDQNAFDAAYQNDPKAVENLFAAYVAEAAPAQQIQPGVTVQTTTPNVTSRGFGELFDTLLERLTNSIDGVVTLADKSFKDQIESATDRISVFDERLEAKRRRLESQFASMEAALAKMQGQGNALASLANNILIGQQR
jgi:flagellar hook-associated protein 2